MAETSVMGNVTNVMWTWDGTRFISSWATTKYPFPSTGLALWLDASDAATVLLDAGGGVVGWQDKSPSQLTLTLGESNTKPAYYDAGENTINGSPAITFSCNGTATKSELKSAVPPMNNADEMTIFIAYRENQRAHAYALVFTEDPDRCLLHAPWFDGNIYFDVGVVGAGSWRVQASWPLEVGTPVVLTLQNRVGSGTRSIRVNGFEIATGGTTTGTELEYVKVGNLGHAMYMSFSDVLVYSGMDVADVTEVETYLMNKIGATAYAPPTYTISFDSNGGSEVSPSSIPGVAAGTYYEQIPGLPADPTMEGMTFGGWMSYNFWDIVLPNYSGYTVSGDETLYAQWY